MRHGVVGEQFPVLHGGNPVDQLLVAPRSRGAVRREGVDLGGGRIIKKKKQHVLVAQAEDVELRGDRHARQPFEPLGGRWVRAPARTGVVLPVGAEFRGGGAGDQHLGDRIGVVGDVHLGIDVNVVAVVERGHAVVDVLRTAEGNAGRAPQRQRGQLVLQNVGRLVAESPHALGSLVHDRLEDVERVALDESVAGPVPFPALVRYARRYGRRGVPVASGAVDRAHPPLVVENVGVAEHVVGGRALAVGHRPDVGVSHEEDAPAVGQGDRVGPVAARGAAPVGDQRRGGRLVEAVDHDVRLGRLHHLAAGDERQVDCYGFVVRHVRQQTRGLVAADRQYLLRLVVRDPVAVELDAVVGQLPREEERVGVRRERHGRERLLVVEDVGSAVCGRGAACRREGRQQAREDRISESEFHLTFFLTFPAGYFRTRLGFRRFSRSG